MMLQCGCGYAGFAEPVNTACPNCQGVMEVPRMIDFEEFRPILEDVMQKIKASIIKHGDWSNYTADDVFDKVSSEFNEYLEAFLAGVAEGRHGQIDELGDLVVTAIKGIRRLRCIEALRGQIVTGE